VAIADFWHTLQNDGKSALAELEFLKRLWGLGTEEEEGYRTGPPGYIGWRNSFLGIDSGALYTFKNTSSGEDRVHHRVHRVATAAFWRTFHHEGKISPGW
jgi:hypothetical protein